MHAQHHRFALVLCDGKVYALWKALIDELRGEAPLLTLAGGESVKELPVLRRLWKKFWQYRIDRGQTVLIIGGGSVLDAVGFAAATWKRGIPFISIPTTFVAQIDAAIGGKVGINFRKGKNLIGTYAEPQAIWVLPDFLRTLPSRDLRAGWVEAYKHALLDGETLWKQIHDTAFTELPSSDLLRALAAVKLRFVGQDPHETQGIRQALNLGHTLGHVWEALAAHTASPLLHGEAVAIGLVQELWLSVKRGFLSVSLWQAVAEKFRQSGLLSSLPPFTWRQWEQYLLQDKKLRDGQLHLPLLTQIGDFRLLPVTIEELKMSVRTYRIQLQTYSHS